MANVIAYHNLSKRTVEVPEHHVNHPILGAHLTIVRSKKKRIRFSEIVKDEAPEVELEIAQAEAPQDKNEDA